MTSAFSAAFARIVALWVAAFVGLAGVAAYVHQASVEHQVCAEHGELIHVGEHGKAPSNRTPGQPDDDAHEHCQLGPASGPAVDLDLGPTTITALVRVHRTTPPPARGPPLAGVDLRSAPKTSPPRA